MSEQVSEYMSELVSGRVSEWVIERVSEYDRLESKWVGKWVSV